MASEIKIDKDIGNALKVADGKLLAQSVVLGSFGGAIVGGVIYAIVKRASRFGGLQLLTALNAVSTSNKEA